MAASKTPTKSGKKINKTAFVLSLPDSLSAGQVVAKAKEAGIALTDKYVWNIRTSARAKQGTPKRKPGRPPRAAASPVSSAPAAARPSASVSAPAANDDASAEREMIRLVLHLGRARAQAIFKAVQQKLDAIERG